MTQELDQVEPEFEVGTEVAEKLTYASKPTKGGTIIAKRRSEASRRVTYLVAFYSGRFEGQTMQFFAEELQNE